MKIEERVSETDIGKLKKGQRKRNFLEPMVASASIAHQHSN
jgi:hypothetical protein